PAALRTLADRLFLPGDPTATAGDNLVLIEAPDVAGEAAAVLRRVKTLLLDGVRPDDVLIAVRDWPTYAPHFAAAARDPGLVSLLALQSSEPLADSPAITALIALLDLPASGFRRRDLLDVLRSPYFDIPGLSEEWVDLLERVSRTQRITGGREAWI